jgi:hypothetical protein
MARMADLTFRDFAGAIMGGDMGRAALVLEALLGLDKPSAATAAGFFKQSMGADPSFMSKAMGLRTAVTTGTDQQIGQLLKDCFNLRGPQVTAAIAALRKHYPA